MTETLLHTLPLDLGPRSYPIHIGHGLIDGVGEFLAARVKGRRLAVVTNTTVAPLYLDRVRVSLEGVGCRVLPIVLPDGEAYKEWTTLNTIFDALIQARCERSTVLCALGGGVVGDITGYAAASFLRGVDFVQIPTTLLAQVDSSVGGKTGINHPLGKNLIGAFYQPRLVVIDVATLATLPPRELAAGLAEVIKYGVIHDPDFLARLEDGMPALLALDPASVARVIHDCCAIKAAVVAVDEREESGHRAVLNFGHTFGHAIEALSGYGQVLHGEAVAMGMVMAMELSCRMGLCGQESVARITRLVARAGLPVKPPVFPAAAYIEAMGRDKKVVDGAIRFILVKEPGRELLINAPAPLDLVAATIDAMTA